MPKAATDICLAPYRESANLSAAGAITWALSSGRPTVASKIEAFQTSQRESSCMLMTAPGKTAELVWAVYRKGGAAGGARAAQSVDQKLKKPAQAA